LYVLDKNHQNSLKALVTCWHMNTVLEITDFESHSEAWKPAVLLGLVDHDSPEQVTQSQNSGCWKGPLGT